MEVVGEAGGHGVFWNIDSRDIYVNENQQRSFSFTVRHDDGAEREYQVGEKLGMGSYAKVKKCVEKSSNQSYAVKIYKRSRLEKSIVDREREQSLEREILLARRLRHPNVVQIYETCECKDLDKILVVLELVEGGSLAALIAQHGYAGVPWPLTRKLFRQLCEGLAYLHSQQVVHRDIKPDNLLLTPNQNLKITDFGTAADISEKGIIPPVAIGSMMFMPPEVVNDKTGDGSGLDMYKIDSWQAGVVLYCMITGRFPFDGRDMYNIVRSIGLYKLSIPDFTDPTLTNILNGLLKRDPAERLTIEQALAHPFTGDTLGVRLFRGLVRGVHQMTHLPAVWRDWRRKAQKLSHHQHSVQSMRGAGGDEAEAEEEEDNQSGDEGEDAVNAAEADDLEDFSLEEHPARTGAIKGAGDSLEAFEEFEDGSLVSGYLRTPPFLPQAGSTTAAPGAEQEGAGASGVGDAHVWREEAGAGGGEEAAAAAAGGVPAKARHDSMSLALSRLSGEWDDYRR